MRIVPVYLLYFWILSLFFDRFLVKKEMQWFHKLVIWTIFFILQLIISRHVNQSLFLFIINCFSIALLSFILYRGSFRKIIFLSIIGCTTSMLIEIFVAYTLQLLEYTIEDTIFAGIIISRLLLLSMVHAISIYQHQRAHDTPSIFCWILLLCTTIFSIFIIHTIFYLNLNSNFTSGDIHAFIAIIFLLTMNIAFYILYNRLSDATKKQIENYIMNRQLKYYEELRANSSAQIDHFKHEKHNLKHQLLAIRSYALQNQNTEIIDFINKLFSNPDFGLAPSSICNNLLLNTLLSSKINLAKQYEINYTWDISVPEKLPFDDTDLCVLIGNALDNAFDACLQTNIISKFVSISIKYKSDGLFCCYQNSFSHKLITLQNHFFASTKPDILNHGYGLSSIRRIVNKYNGLIDIETTENLFVLRTILYTQYPVH